MEMSTGSISLFSFRIIKCFILRLPFAGEESVSLISDSFLVTCNGRRVLFCVYNFEVGGCILINSKQSPQNAQPPPCCRGRSPPLSCTSPRLQTSSSRRPGRYQTPWDKLSLYIILHECSFPALMDSPAEANHACSSEKTLAGCVHSPTVRV